MSSLATRITKLLKPITKTIHIALFNTPPPPPSPSPSSGSYRIRHEDESRNVRVAVWWDIENCGVPTGVNVNVHNITHLITTAVRVNGIKGALEINAFGDVDCISRLNQLALSSTGVNLIHVPHDGKNSADRSLLVDLMNWVSQNPPPAHIFLISGDRDFAGILHKLRMRNYNILLAAREPGQTPGALCSAASIVWYWSDLTKGKNLLGKHFNQPPDAPFHSWYGQYQGPLEDPFAVHKPQKYSDAKETSDSEASSKVPMTVLRQLRRLVNSHPGGLSITELRDQLSKSKVVIDKDFYGYMKFSRFLMAFPRIVKVESRPDGQFFLKPASSIKIPKPVENNDISALTMTVSSIGDDQLTAKAKGKLPTITRMVDDEKEKTAEAKPLEETSEIKVLGVSPSNNVVDSVKDPSETLKADIAETESNSEGENGLFRILWTKLFRRSIDAEKPEDNGPLRLSTSSVSPEKSISLALIAKDDKVGEVEASHGFIAKNKSAIYKQIEIPSYAPRAVGKDTSEFDDVPCSKKLDDDASHERKHMLFTKDFFWNALRSFFETHRGSAIVSNSLSREQIAEKIQKEGPSFLLPLETIQIRHLVDLLVDEKKWIKEFPTKSPRFRLFSPSLETSTPSRPQNSNGLSSVLLNSSSHDNHQLTVSSVVHENPPEKCRNEILADCQKLLDEVLSLHPHSLNMGEVKKQFLKKYGYGLDYKKLGFTKLVNLLQIMHGLKIGSTCIFRDDVVSDPRIQSLGPEEKSTRSDSDSSGSTLKDDDVESSTWGELGPSEKSDLNKVNGDCELPMVENDELSNAEREEQLSTLSQLIVAEPRKSRKVDQKDESLLQLLDSWDTSNNKTNPKDHVSDHEKPPDSSVDESNPLQSFINGHKSDILAKVNNRQKNRSQKSYSVQVFEVGEIKDKLNNSIRASLETSGETRVPKIQR